MTDESVSERNSMSPPYRYWTQEQFIPLTEAELKAADKRRKELQAKHEQTNTINLWEDIK